jgi:hypothetical protein
MLCHYRIHLKSGSKNTELDKLYQDNSTKNLTIKQLLILKYIYIFMLLYIYKSSRYIIAARCLISQKSMNHICFLQFLFIYEHKMTKCFQWKYK